VATEELIAAMRRIKTEDDPQKLERIARVLQKLDDNQDGKIEVEDIIKVKNQFFLWIPVISY